MDAYVCLGVLRVWDLGFRVWCSGFCLAQLYASGIPQAIEVLRLATGTSQLQGSEIQRLSTDPEQLAMLLHEAEEGNLAVIINPKCAKFLHKAET